MTIRNFDALFEPTSVALIGASPREGSLGNVIRHNLARGGFDGMLHLVNPRYDTIDNAPCVPSVLALPDGVDLAVIVAPPRVLPETIAELGDMGGRAAVVISAGVKGLLKQQMLDAARPRCLRILGPNCIGLQAPHLGLDASFADRAAKPGTLALVSQSGAIIAALLDWAAVEGIGFSSVVSLGDMADIDVGDMLDYLAADPKTDAILLYLEHVTDARKFMSAARRASRTKPVIAVKAGRSAQAARAATSHTGALAGSDAVYDAALRRAGILRVEGLEELFDAAETLARLRPLSSGRLAVVTNGGGAGVLAADAVADEKLVLADLGGMTLNRLDHALPPHWSHANPIDIIGDAKGDRYIEALEIVLEDSEIDAVLVMNCPTGLASSEAAARAVISVHEGRDRKESVAKPLLGCWLGAKTAAPASKLLEEAGIPSFSTPKHAVRGFAYLVRHGEAQRQLTRTPPALPPGSGPDRKVVRSVLRKAFSEGRTVLTEPEAKAVLTAYAIPAVETLVAATPEDARNMAETLREGGAKAFVAKILSRDITHKSDVGGVRLHLSSPAEVEAASRSIIATCGKLRPEARIDGVVVQPMIDRGDAFELILGIGNDAVFGPVILFGAGGTSVEVVDDKALALPPLDPLLAADMIARTRIARLLDGYRDRTGVDKEAIIRCLVALSSLSADFPEISELDMNPLLASDTGVVALDARILVAKASEVEPGGNPRFAIRPYPSAWVSPASVRYGEIILRPIRPEDETLYRDFVARLTPGDIRFRFFGAVGMPTHRQLSRLTQIDYAREIAFVAVDPAQGTLLGIARFVADAGHEEAEFAIIVRSDIQGQGIGGALMRHLIDYAGADGLRRLWGMAFDGNRAMSTLATALGFVASDDPQDSDFQRFVLDLASDDSGSSFNRKK